MVPTWAARWSVETDGRERPLSSLRIEGVEYLSLSDIALAFGGQVQRDPQSGNYIYVVQERRIVLSSREGLASLDAQILTFSHPNQVIQGELWVVPEFIEKALVPVFDRTIRRSGNRFEVKGARPLDVKFRSSHDAGGTRAVLEFSRPVRYELDADSRGVRVRVIDGPLRDVELPSEVEGTEVRSLGFEPAGGGVGGIFAFEAGPTYGEVRTSELDSPFRVVLDFDSSGGPGISKAPDLPPVSTPRPGRAPHGVRTVVLDPGHGGEEMGAEGPTNLAEKEVVLDIARRTARLLRDRLRVEVVQTRESDLDIPLDERAAIANHQNGDLFISIHANASLRAGASGAETYFLSYDPSDDESSLVAERENLGSSAAPAAPAGGVEMILWEMAQAEHLAESFLLAETVQQEFNDLLGTRDRGVRQAPFRVLMGAAMPAVLVEVAFITNPNEEELLSTPQFRELVAEALVAGVARYKRSYEGRVGVTGSRDRKGRGGS